MNPFKTDQLTSGYVRCKLPGRSLIFSTLIDSSYDLMSEPLVKKLNLQVNPAKLELGTAGKGKKIQVIESAILSTFTSKVVVKCLKLLHI